MKTADMQFSDAFSGDQSLYLYGDASLSFQVHEVHGGSNIVLPPHLHTHTHNAGHGVECDQREPITSQ